MPNLPPTLATPGSVALAVTEAARGPLPVLAASTAATTTFSGPEVMGLSGVLNLIAQGVKMHPRFDQNLWLLPVLLVLGIGLAFLVIWLTTDDVRQALSQAILKGGSAAWQSCINYAGLGPKGLGVLGAGTEVQ